MCYIYVTCTVVYMCKYTDKLSVGIYIVLIQKIIYQQYLLNVVIHVNTCVHMQTSF